MDLIRCPVRVLRVLDGAEVGTAGEPPSKRVWWADPLGFTPGGRGLAINFYPQYVRVADVSSGSLGPPIRPTGTPEMSPDGRRIATFSSEAVVLADATTGADVRRVELAPEVMRPRLGDGHRHPPTKVRNTITRERRGGWQKVAYHPAILAPGG